MQFTINIDFESEVATILVDDLFVLTARRNSENKMEYKNFDKLDSEETELVIKKVVDLLFSIPQE